LPLALIGMSFEEKNNYEKMRLGSNPVLFAYIALLIGLLAAPIGIHINGIS
jgi:hypothetical protein